MVIVVVVFVVVFVVVVVVVFVGVEFIAIITASKYKFMSSVCKITSSVRKVMSSLCSRLRQWHGHSETEEEEIEEI